MKKFFFICLFISFGVTAFLGMFWVQNPTLEKFFLDFCISALYIYTIGFSQMLLNNFLSQRWDWISQTYERVTFGIIFTILISVASVLLCNYINFILIQKMPVEVFWTEKMWWVHIFNILISLGVSTFLHARSFMIEWKKSAITQVVEQKIIATSANVRFESLKNQLDPHFLFNSLNVLSSLIDENPHKAQEFTASMSKIYRYILDKKDKELVSVEEELDFAETYCEMLTARFEDSVSFHFEIEPEVKKAFIVPLSLQLLLENCIKHNFATEQKPLKIRVYSENQYLIVENNLQPRKSIHQSSGIGLNNISARYNLITNKKVFIEKTENHFSVKIPILLTSKIKIMQTTNENLAYDRAYKRMKEIKSFYMHLITYLVMNTFFICLNLYHNPNHLWFWWPLGCWGFGVVMNGLSVFSPFGNSWEKRKVREIMEKEEKEI